MVDLHGRITLQSNVANLANEINSELKKVKGHLNIVSKASVDNIDRAGAALLNLRKAFIAVESEAAKMSVVFTKMRSAATAMNKALGTQATVLKQTGRGHRESAESVRKHMSVMAQFGDQAAIAAKRYTAFTIAVGLGFGAVRATQEAIKGAIQFQDKLVKMSQVSGKSLAALKPLTQEISKLSSAWGVSSDKLADVSLVLLQAGYTSRDVKKSLEALAKVELAPSFGNMEQAAEAAIAIISQFGTTVDDLKGQFSSINKVSAEFAVEASDIVLAIQRSGAAFGQLAKEMDDPKDALNQFIALFTSVRATTRESAETIATGLRTIFSRLQRQSTHEMFHKMNIELEDAKGRFIGLYPAIERISNAIKDIPYTDPRIAQIGEELGGFRQINKTIPLLTQLEKAQEALNVARRAGNNLDEVAEQSQESLARKIEKVHQQFLALFRDIEGTQTFKILANGMILATEWAIKLASAVKPLIPLFTLLAGFKALQSAQQFIPAFSQRIMGQGVNRMNIPYGKAGGGIIPGTGRGDVQPIMAEPGEFMIRKSAAQRIGYGNLHRLNKYAGGGVIRGGNPPIDRYATGGTIRGGLSILNPDLTPKGPYGVQQPQQLQAIIAPLQELVAIERQILAVDKNIAPPAPRVGGKFQATTYKINKGYYHLGTPSYIGGGPGYNIGDMAQPTAPEGYGIQHGTYPLAGQIQPGRPHPNRYPSEYNLAAVQPQGPYGPFEQHPRWWLNQNPSRRLQVNPTAYLPPMNQAEFMLAHAQPMQSTPGSSSGGLSNATLAYMNLGNRGGRNLRSSFLQTMSGLGNRILGTRQQIPMTPEEMLRAGIFGGQGFKNGPRVGGAIRQGLGRAWDRVVGMSATGGLTLASAVGAGVANQIGGSVATNAPGKRGRGAIADVTAGTLGGLAAGASTGNPYAAAAGAVIGFAVSVTESTEELKRFNLNDALEEALNTEKKGGKGDFNKIVEESKSLGIVDYLKAGAVAHPFSQIADNISKGDRSLGSLNFFGGGINAFNKSTEQARIARGEQFAKEHEGDIKAGFQNRLQEAGKKYGTFQEFAKNETALVAEFRKALPHLAGEDITRSLKKGTGLGGGKMNLNNAIDSIDKVVSGLSDMADAMNSAHVATAGLTNALDLNLNMFGGGISKYANRSALISNPNVATFGETAKELGGLPPEVGFAAYTQANIRRLALAAHQGVVNTSNPEETIDTVMSDLMDTLVKEAKGFGIEGAGRDEMQAMLLHSVKEGGVKTANFPQFLKKFENPLKEILGPAAEINQESVARKNEFLEAMKGVTGERINAGRGRFAAKTTGVEAYNTALGFQGITQGSRSNFASFIGMQNKLAGGMGMNPEAIGARLGQLQGMRNTPGEFSPKELANINTEFMMLSHALENLTKATEQNTSIEKQLAEINANRGERVGIGEEFLGANPGGRAQIIRSLQLVQAFKAGGLNLQNLGPEDFNLLSERVKKSGNIFPGLGHQFEESVLGAAGVQLPNADFMKKEQLQADILGNFGRQQQAQNIQAGLQEGAAGVAAGQAGARFEAQMAPLFGNFADRFEKAVGMMPHEIKINSDGLQLQVNINGAEAFAKMQPQFQELVTGRIQQALDRLVGQMREKPPNGPGLPISNVRV